MGNGEAYERRVYSIMPELIKEVGLSPSHCSTHRNKGYYSKERRSDIQVDISVEVRRRGERDPAFIWILECKNLTRPVDIKDAEAFSSKLSQIGDHNTKGTIVSSSGFRRGVQEYCESKKIGLIHLPEDGGEPLHKNQMDLVSAFIPPIILLPVTGTLLVGKWIKEKFFS